MNVVITGVSGSGKTTIGQRLAARLGWSFVDGDDLHPSANVEKMRRGEPLDDADRAPWLARMNRTLLERTAAGEGTVLACSALKRRYREALAAGLPEGELRFVRLRGSYELIASRLAGRKGHFMPPSLLRSQFDALDEPDAATLVVGIEAGPEEIVAEIVRRLGPAEPPRAG